MKELRICEEVDKDPVLPSGIGVPFSEEVHCITCSDQALPAKVLRVDQETETALVLVRVPSRTGDITEEIDVSLVEMVLPGDLLLVHGGVALARLVDGEN